MDLFDIYWIIVLIVGKIWEELDEENTEKSQSHSEPRKKLIMKWVHLCVEMESNSNCKENQILSCDGHTY